MTKFQFAVTRVSSLLLATIFFLIASLLIERTVSQELFPLFFQQPQVWQQHQTQLPPKKRQGSSPNEKLKKCCDTLHQADADCKSRFCDFNSLSSNTVLFFLSTCAPRGLTVGQMWDCASSRADHQTCCAAKGVRSSCMAYCETTNGVPTDYLKYLACLHDFDKIRDCFKYYLEDHPNLKGQM